MTRTLALSLAVCLFTWCAGCGYSTRSLITADFSTIAVVPFVNKIDITQESDTAGRYKVYKPQLEAEITRVVTDAFLIDGNLKPTDSDSADIVLKGELVEFRRDPLRYTDSDDVAEYRLNIMVNLQAWDRAKAVLLWEEKRFTGDATYFVSGSEASSEDTATTEAVRDLARRIVERVVEQW